MTDNTETVGPKYPDITVQLSGHDGNAFAVMAAVRRALEKAGVPSAETRRYTEESMSGNYDDLIVTATKWVTVL